MADLQPAGPGPSLRTAGSEGNDEIPKYLITQGNPKNRIPKAKSQLPQSLLRSSGPSR